MSEPSHVHGLVAALVEERSGLHYRAGERDLFVDKLQDHARDEGFESLLEYYYHLRYDPDGSAALDRLVEMLLVHESYFFRELPALTAAIDNFVVPVVQAGRRARVWSAACAGGEEPLSLAMLLADRGILDRCDILATDISERSLAQAKVGRFRPRSLRSEGLEPAERWLVRDGDTIVAPRAFVGAIDWYRMNLCDAAAVAALGPFDLIVCRHVLIYFDAPRVEAVVAALAGQLRPNGALLVGVSESLLRFSTELACEEIGRVFVYRRKR